MIENDTLMLVCVWNKTDGWELCSWRVIGLVGLLLFIDWKGRSFDTVDRRGFSSKCPRFDD